MWHKGGERSQGDPCSERGTPAAMRRITGNWGGGWGVCVCVCVCVCVVGSVGEGHEAEIALRIHYARLSSRESGAALVQDGQQTHD